MSKKAKLITIISSVTVAVALIVLTICLIVANNNREKTNYSIISCTAGTSAHLVLNANDKVSDIVPLTDEAKGIALNNEFVGLKYADAVKLFVTKNVEAGYLDINTEGYTVKITIGGCRQNYEKYTKTMKSDINDYLSNMGIIAGAKVEEKTSLADTIKELKATAQNTDKATNKELIEKHETLADMVENILPSLYSNFFAGYDNYDKEYKDTLADCDELIKSREAQIDELNKEIANLPNGTEKTNKQNEITTYQLNIQNAQDRRDTAENRLRIQVADLINTYSVNKDSDNANLTTKYKADKTASEATLSAHKTAFESNKQATLDKIDAYRKTI